ncbi:glycine betaine/L-proline ABC transporter, ATP-binding protein ProV [Streptococcus pseudoporcinus]|uniref:Glycine betaine/L-proline ABC transporter, ATP-binding protein ProV n=1 Tax=Streptococcus pseudoporcinus TaxID=361101 RepID=A0A4U9XL16_9STRE|nr:glycine betaine/L-proline ABC transporter, ATP-binding protein ProV [Streptococcus pseudoporcinus]
MGNILEVRHLTKIFGKKQKVALEMIKQGKSKTEIFKKTGATVGVYDAASMSKKVKYSLLWDFRAVVNQL